MKTNKKEFHSALKVLSLVNKEKIYLSSYNNRLHIHAEGFLKNISEISASTSISCEDTYHVQGCFSTSLLLNLSKGKGVFEIEPVHIETMDENGVIITKKDQYLCQGVQIPSEPRIELHEADPASTAELISQQNGKEFQNNLKFVLPAVSKDICRKNLTYISLNNGILTSTNDHVVSRVPQLNPSTKPIFIDPVIAKMLCCIDLDTEDFVNLSFRDNNLEIEAGTWKLITKNPDITYPDSERVWKNFCEEMLKVSIICDIKPLIAAINTLKVVAKASENGSNGITLGLSKTELFVAYEDTKIVLQSSLSNDIEFKTQLNLEYVINAIIQAEDKVIIMPTKNRNVFVQVDASRKVSLISRMGL